jgi:hypothetical protein
VTKNVTYVEKEARDYETQYCGEDYSDVTDGVNRKSIRAAFIAGDAHGYQRAVSGARGGLDRWLNDNRHLFEYSRPARFAAEVWTAARLSCAKEMAEKDARIDRHENYTVPGFEQLMDEARSRIAALEDELAAMWTDELTSTSREDCREKGIYPLAQEIADKNKRAALEKHKNGT